MNRRIWIAAWLAAVVALGFAPTTAFAASIVPGTVSRSVEADVMIMEPGQSSSQNNIRSSDALGLFDRIVFAEGETDHASEFASADQISDIDSMSVVGEGFVSTEGSLEMGCAMAHADSLFNYEFEVDEDVLADILFSASAFGEGSGSIGQVELLADGVSILSLVVESADGVERFDDLMDQILLMSGVVYEIVALAKTWGAHDVATSFSGGDADFSFSLNVVPEPGTLSLVLPGLLLLTIRRRNERRNLG